MTHAVETMAYKGEVPWHGLGFSVKQEQTPAQMLKAAGLDWTVSKRGIYYLDKNKKNTLIKDKYALVRDKDDAQLSIVGSTYKPVQNAEAIDFFKKFTDAGKMTMETAGSLWGGRYVWGLARVGADFKIGKNDEMRSYLLLCSPHVHGKAMIIQFTPIRVVCWNTLSFALGDSLRGSKHAFRMPHTQKFDQATKQAAEFSLGLAMEQAKDFKEAAGLLAKKKAPADKVEEYFGHLLKYDPADARKKADGTNVVPRMLPKFQEALQLAPGSQNASALGTWWGAVNAVTYVTDHVVGRQRDTALAGAWFGWNADLKRRAVDLALDYAK